MIQARPALRNYGMSISSDEGAPQRGPGPLALAAYAAPQLALAAMYFPVFAFVIPFYNEQRGLSLEVLGLIFVAVRLVDAVTDPLMGAVSDATRSRFGRRKVWMAAATPLVCLSVWMTMVPGPETSAAYVAFWVLALTLSWTMALTPYFAWGGEISSDYRGRTAVTAWRETVFLVGTLLAAALYGSAPEDPALGLERVASAVLITLPVGVALAIALAPEPKPRFGVEAAAGALSWTAWKATAQALWANGPMRRFMTSHILNSAANGLPPVLLLLYVTNVLGGTGADFATAFILYFAGAIVAAPFWSLFTQRASKHRVWCYAMLYSMAIFALVPFLGQGDVGLFFAISVLTGLAYGADIVLPPAIQADVVDVDTAETGVERTGVYFALWSVVLKGASGLAGGAAAIALGLAGFQSGADNSAAAMTALVSLYAVAPIILKGFAIAAIWRFPIDAAAQAELRRRIHVAAGS